MIFALSKRILISQSLHLSIPLMVGCSYINVWLFVFSFSFQWHKLNVLTLCSLCIFPIPNQRIDTVCPGSSRNEFRKLFLNLPLASEYPCSPRFCLRRLVTSHVFTGVGLLCSLTCVTVVVNIFVLMYMPK